MSPFKHLAPLRFQEIFFLKRCNIYIYIYIYIYIKMRLQMVLANLLQYLSGISTLTRNDGIDSAGISHLVFFP